MVLLDKQEEIELDDTLQKVVERRDIYISESNERLFIENENKRVSNRYREYTFLQFMDNFIADIYLSLQAEEHLDDKDIATELTQALHVMKERAEHHGFLEEYKMRREEPVKFAKRRLDQRKQNKEFTFDP